MTEKLFGEVISFIIVKNKPDSPVNVVICPVTIDEEVPQHHDPDHDCKCDVVPEKIGVQAVFRSVQDLEFRAEERFQQGEYWRTDEQSRQVYEGKLADLMAKRLGTRFRIRPVTVPYKITGDCHTEGNDLGHNRVDV